MAIACAREGADILIRYPNEQESADAREPASHVEAAGVWQPRRGAHCRAIIDWAVSEFERLDILVNNAAFQRTYESLDEIPDEEWDHTFRTNIAAMFHLAKAAVLMRARLIDPIGQTQPNPTRTRWRPFRSGRP